MRKLAVAAVGLLCAVVAPSTLRAADPQTPVGLGVFGEGGGAEGGAADPQTGAMTYTIPFKMLRARGAAQPSLSLAYSSRAGSREAGVGWGLSLPTIERQPLSGWPSFNDGSGADPSVKDRFAFDGKPLVYLCTVGSGAGGHMCPTDPTSAAGENWSFPAWANNAQYFRLQVDGMGARFFFFPLDHRWRVQLPGGTVMELGAPTTLPGLTDPAFDIEGTEVARYKLSRLVDVWGNTAVYRWQVLGGRGLRYLTDIYDTSEVSNPSDLDSYAHHVQLEWEAPAGYTVRTLARADRGSPDLRLRRVGVAAAPWQGATAREVVRVYDLAYLDRRDDNGTDGFDPANDAPVWNRSFLRSLRTMGKCAGVEVSGHIDEAYQCSAHEPMTFEYQALAPIVGGSVLERTGVDGTIWNVEASAVVDANRDGLPDIVRSWPYLAADHFEAHLLLRNNRSAAGTSEFVRDCIDGGAPTDPTGMFQREGGNVNWDHVHYRFLGPRGRTLVGAWGDTFAMWSASTPPSEYLPVRLVPTTLQERFCPNIAGWDPHNAYKWSYAGPTGWLQPVPDPVAKDDPRFMVDADGDGLQDATNFVDLGGHGWNQGRVAFTRRVPAGTVAPAPFGASPSARQLAFYTEGPVTAIPIRPGDNKADLYHQWYADIDGDGLPELVLASPVDHGGTFEVRPGNGRGSFGCDATKSPFCAGGGAYYELSGVTFGGRSSYFADVTGDGLADLIVPAVGPDEGIVRLWINQDGKNFACAAPATGCKVAQLGDNCPSVNGSTGFNACFQGNPKPVRVSFADMNGDGVSDMVAVRDDFVWVWSATRAATFAVPPASFWAHAPKPGLLTRINDGRGKTMEVKYDSAQLLDRGASPGWSSHLPQTTQVVSTIHVANTRHARGDSSDAPDFKPERWTNYKYRDPAFDPWRQQFVGFRTVQVDHGGGSKVETQYWYSRCERDSITQCPGGTDDDDWRWKSGRVVRVDHLSATAQGQQRRLSTEYPKWNGRILAQGQTVSDRRRVWLPFREEQLTYLYDGASPTGDAGATPDPDGDPLPLPATQNGRVELRSTSTVDNHGNVTVRADFGRTDAPDAIVSSIQVVCNENNQCLTGASTLSWPSAPGAAGWVDRHRSFTYGAHGELRTVSAYLDRSATLDRRHAAGGAVAPLPVGASVAGEVEVLHLSYDSFGNVIQSHGANQTSCVTIERDERYAQLPELIHHHRNGCGPLATTLVETLVWDRGHEQPVQVWGPNYDPSATVYDAFGRPIQVYSPAPDALAALALSAEVAYDDGSEASPVHRTRSTLYTSEADVLESVTLDNVFDEPIATYQRDGAAWDVSGYVQRNAQGLVYYAQRPSQTLQDPMTVATLAGAPRGTTPDNVFSVAYDEYGRVTTVTDGSTPVAQYQRTPLSVTTRDAEQLSASSSHKFASTVVELDGHGRTFKERRITSGATLVRTRSYLASGEPWREEQTGPPNPGAVIRTAVYDSLGRLVENHEPNTEVSDGNGGTHFWRYAWDDAGRLVATSDPRGCGKNVFYDGMGRTLGEDYSPCAAAHPAYSSPDLITGEGAETFYTYDDYEPGQVASTPTFLDHNLYAVGRLVSVRDRGAHSRFNYDARGRVRRSARQIARPSSAPPAASPYTDHWFVRESDFDLANRPTSETTGASAPLLMGWGGRSEVSYGYDVAGRLHHVNSSYDGLVSGMQYAPDGQLTAVAYADAASTTAAFTYDARRRLTDYTLRRPGGSPMWTAATPPPTYPLPNSQTTQRELTWLHYTRDLVGNPTAIDDLAPQSATTAWPTGAKPVVQRTFTYDDVYRVLTAGYRYMGNALSPNDGQVNPYAKELTEPGSPAPIPRRTVSTRVRQQTFAYDHLGNITSTGDDQSLRFDRSLGAVTHSASHPNQLVSASGVAARYDDAGNLVDLTVTRPGACDAGKCAQRFAYEWDEVGQLTRARRWDYAGNSIPPTEPVHPAVPTQAPDRDLRYAYSMGSRVLKSVADETSAELHTLEVFSSLRVERAQLLGDDYELDENTERVSLAGLGKLVYDPALPSWSGEPKHVFLTMSDHLGSAAFVLDRDSGEVVEKITHQAYGEVESDYRPARWKSQREVHRFTGKEDDFEVGLTYFGARYYHARLGRWMSPDPLTIHLGASDPNPYAYVSGRASTHFDPNGLCSADDASDCIGGAYWADTHQPWLSVGDDYWQPQFGDGGLIGHTYREWVADGRPSTTFGPEPVGPEIGPSSPPVTSIGTGGQAAGSAGGWANTYSETPISNPRSDYLASQHPALKASIQGARNQELVVEYAPWVLALLPAMRGVAADEALLAAAGRRGPAATRDLAQKVAAAERGPMRFMRTVTVLETKEGPTLVAGGASDLSPGQVEVARSLGLTPAPPMPGIHAEPNAIFGAGELGLTPVRGATTSRICAGPGGCTETIQQLGGRITSPFTYEF